MPGGAAIEDPSGTGHPIDHDLDLEGWTIVNWFRRSPRPPDQPERVDPLKLLSGPAVESPPPPVNPRVEMWRKAAPMCQSWLDQDSTQQLPLIEVTTTPANYQRPPDLPPLPLAERRAMGYQEPDPPTYPQGIVPAPTWKPDPPPWPEPERFWPPDIDTHVPRHLRRDDGSASLQPREPAPGPANWCR